MKNQGDFERVMLPHLDAAYNLALAGSRHVGAEDVVQNAYERACKYFAAFRGGSGRPLAAADRTQRRLLDAQSQATANGGFAQQRNGCGR